MPAEATRERIVLTSLELFNRRGERNVTTNHIAAHLGISPGNLYYHFPNKQAIILRLFETFTERVDAVLKRPEGRTLTIEDKVVYLEALLSVMWEYRFLHPYLQVQLQSEAHLAEAYRRFARRVLAQARSIYRGFVEAGILDMNERQIEALVINSWIILTSWVQFLATIQGGHGELSEAQVRRGVYQVLALEAGHVTQGAASGIASLDDRFHVSLDQVIPSLDF